jgi:hypothetical protein
MRKSGSKSHHGPAGGGDKLPRSLTLHGRAAPRRATTQRRPNTTIPTATATATYTDTFPPTVPALPEPAARATSSTDCRHVAHQPHTLALRLLPIPRGSPRRSDWPLRQRLSDVLAARWVRARRVPLYVRQRSNAVEASVYRPWEQSEREALLRFGCVDDDESRPCWCWARSIGAISLKNPIVSTKTRSFTFLSFKPGTHGSVRG